METIILLLLLLQGILPVDGQNFVCPEDEDGCITGQYPDPVSCAYYYNCAPGLLFECIQTRMQCPELFAFDKNTSQCVLGIDAACDVVGDNLVFAGAMSGHTSAADPFPYPLITKKGHQWNESSNSFTINEATGVYLIGWTVGVPTQQKADFTVILNGQKYASITGSSTSHNNVKTIGRDLVMPLYAADVIHISSGYQSFSGNSNFETTVNLFSISDAMVNNSAFSVARTTSLSGGTRVVFDNILYNDDFYYYDGIYSAPGDGIYMFSFSVGISSGENQNFTLYRDDEEYVNILHLASNTNGVTTIGRSVMMTLEEGEEIYIENKDGMTALSSDLIETSFCGFKYEPKHGYPVAWSVARNTSVSTRADPLYFPIVLVDVGSAWHRSSNTVVIPQAGYYYIYVGGGAHRERVTYIYFVANGALKFAVLDYTTSNSGETTMGKSGIFLWDKGDVLKVTTWDTGAYSDWGMQTMFFGFLIYQT